MLSPKTIVSLTALLSTTLFPVGASAETVSIENTKVVATYPLPIFDGPILGSSELVDPRQAIATGTVPVVTSNKFSIVVDFNSAVLTVTAGIARSELRSTDGLLNINSATVHCTSPYTGGGSTYSFPVSASIAYRTLGTTIPIDLKGNCAIGKPLDIELFPRDITGAFYLAREQNAYPLWQGETMLKGQIKITTTIRDYGGSYDSYGPYFTMPPSASPHSLGFVSPSYQSFAEGIVGETINVPVNIVMRTSPSSSYENFSLKLLDSGGCSVALKRVALGALETNVNVYTHYNKDIKDINVPLPFSVMCTTAGKNTVNLVLTKKNK